MTVLRPQSTLDDDSYVDVAPPDKPARGGLAGRVLDRNALSFLPMPEPLIDGTIDLRTLAILAGAYGTRAA